ncbi:MAG: hypothetical protein QG656_333, partial [Candidatus Hydrogenedentes bacterium]|nr:hypothetical protein [Candidatus Hydrogenedentota bacterium]
LEPLADDIPMSPQILYESGFDIEPGDEAEILAETYTPYFNRAWNHFCSHSQTPPEKKGDSPAAIRAGNVVYFTHPLFRMFMRRGVRTYKQLVLNALNLLLPEPLVKTNAPTTAHITLLFQPIEQRHVLHVLHYIPERRYRDLATIEDVIPLRDVEVGLRLPAPQAAYLAPSGEALTFTERGGRVWLTIPEVHGHAMVVLEGHGGAE